MKKNTKRAVAVLLIFCIALLSGFLIDFLWTKLERKSYSTDYDEIITRYSDTYNVPKSVIYAVIKTESGYTIA